MVLHSYLAWMVISGVSWAQQTPAPSASPVTPQVTVPTQQKQDQDDFSSTPYTEFGEFSDAEEETATNQFFQYGRFFGLSLGSGFHSVTGNRGNLWRGGFPMLAFRLHYWFDFQMGFQLEYDTSPHFYEPTEGTRIDISMAQLGISLKYYFDTRRAASAVEFSNPYLLAGVGTYRKIEKNLSTDITTDLSAVGASLGGGLEFPLVHRKTYINLEGRATIVPFTDRFDTPAGTTVADMQGLFYQVMMNFLFTW